MNLPSPLAGEGSRRRRVGEGAFSNCFAASPFCFTKQTFIGCPTNARLESFVFAEFFRKTGKTTFANSA
jgi:hypothetical protein